MRAAALLALLAACTVEHDVLVDPVGVVTSCDEAWFSQPGAPCAFEGTCDRASPDEPGCCTEYAYCAIEGLVADVFCDPQCACSDDASCEFGAAICNGVRCEPCPSTDVCGACPDGWVRLTRNGCETCECAPASECDVPGAECEMPFELCYVGASCASGCNDPNLPGCCANVCSAAGCAEPAPLGCYMDCEPDTGCTTCAAGACECIDGRWSCAPTCVGELSFSCFVP